MAISSAYRKACRGEDEQKDDLNFSDEQLKRINDRIYEIASCSENEGLALKAAMYIRDDKKGRRDAIKVLAGNTFNVLNFNQQLRAAKGAVEKALGLDNTGKQLTSGGPIDV